jgi:hypothetical protein
MFLICYHYLKLLDQESDKSYGRELCDNEEDVLCIEDDASGPNRLSLNDDDASGGFQRKILLLVMAGGNIYF